MRFDPNNPLHQQILAEGIRRGQMSAGNGGQTLDLRFQEAVSALKNEQQAQINRLSGAMRREMQKQIDRADEQLNALCSLASSLVGTKSGGENPGLLRIEDIPGRRVPFTYLVDIPIGAGDTSIKQNSFTVTMGGPFVATKRVCIFQSAYEYRFTNSLTSEEGHLAARSYGRFRPIHSAADLNDSQHAAVGDSTSWFLTAADLAANTDPLPSGALVLPSNMASFRSMEFDGRIEVVAAASQQPRSNLSLPTSMWVDGLNGGVDLPALDFFERGDTCTFNVQPTHVNNPEAGNVDGECIFPLAAGAGFVGWPFVGGQYDAHEGICTPAAIFKGAADGDFEPVTADPVSRVPNGVLIVGFEGYRIFQSTGPVP